MNEFLKITLFSICIIPFLAAVLQGGEDVTRAFHNVSKEIETLERRIEQEIRDDQWETFYQRFSLPGREMKSIRQWCSGIQQAKRSQKIESLVVDLPILGMTRNTLCIFYGRMDVIFEGGDPDRPLRCPLRLLSLEKEDGKWVFKPADLSPLPSPSEVRVERGEFQVAPHLETSTVEAESTFVVVNENTTPLKRIPVYLRHPHQWESMELDGEPIHGEVTLGLIEGQPAACCVVELDRELKKGESCELRFRYSLCYPYYFSRKPVGFTKDRGFVLWECGWYPHVNQSLEMFPYGIEIRVPRGLKALSSGKRVDHESRGGHDIYTYKMESDGTPYFVWGDYQETVQRVGKSRLIFWQPEQHDIELEHVKKTYVDVFRLFQELLPAPQLDSFHVVAVTRYGGYGPKGVMLIYDNYYDAKTALSAETMDLLAHEFSHAWVNSIAVPEGDGMMGLFLSESLAVYLGAKAVERLKGCAEAAEIWQRNRGMYLKTAHRALAPSELSEAVQLSDNPMFRAVAYYKGAYLLRELESFVGEEVLFEALGRTLKNRKGGVFTLEQLMSSVQELSGRNLEKYWRSFVRSNKHPDYRIVPASESGPAMKVKVENLGAPSPVPVQVAAYDENGVETARKKVVLSGAKSEVLEFGKVASLVIDPDKQILQSDIRNDVYPDYIVPEDDFQAIESLVERLMTALNEHDADAFDSLVTRDRSLLGSSERKQILSSAGSHPFKSFIRKGEIQLFGKAGGQAVAEFEVVGKHPSGAYDMWGKFSFVKEGDEWKNVNFNLDER